MAERMKRLATILFAMMPIASAQEWQAPQPYSVDSIRAWQHSPGDWPWAYPPEQELKLHGEDEMQLLVAVAGGARYVRER